LTGFETRSKPAAVASRPGPLCEKGTPNTRSTAFKWAHASWDNASGDVSRRSRRAARWNCMRPFRG